MNFKNRIIFIVGILLLFIIGFKKINDYQDYNPTVIVETYKYTEQKNKELFKGGILTDEFRAKNNNLGIISLLFTTHNRINDDYLQFSIKEKGQKDWYYTNKYKVDQFQDYQYFPFGFPEIRNSKGKIYQIQIESLDGKENNSIGIIRDGKSFLSKYSFPKAYLLEHKKEIPLFMLGKIRSFFNYIDSNVYLFVLLISLLSIYLSRVIDINKLTNFFKRFNKVVVKNNNLFMVRIKNSKLTIPVLIMLSILGLFIVNLWLNWPIRLKSLAFGDDLISWDFFNINRNNFFEYIFSTGANKFRPVFLVVFFGLFKIFGTNIGLFGVFNILFSFLIGVILFLMFHKISKSIIVSFCLAAAFILSRFAYYDITQALGVMEAMALLFSVLLFYLLWQYLNTEKLKYYWISLIVFTMLIFTHERFITILGVYFVLFLIFGLKRKNVLLYIYSTLPVILSFVLKIFVLQIRPLDGTGGTDILQTFNIGGFFQNFFSAWLYIFGVNAGPTYLNGISSEGVSLYINNLILIGNICLFLIVIILGISVLKSKKMLFKEYFRNFILFITFIFVTLLAGSVTFRLEMRWLYVPFVGLLFLLAYMSKVIIAKRVFVLPFFLIFFIWFSVYTPREIFYRSYYKNIYYWGVQTFGNALYDATLGNYGSDFWNYKTYIICEDKTFFSILGYNNSKDINLFFRQFENKGNKANLYLVDKIPGTKIISNENKVLLLKYDQLQDKFIELILNK